MSKLKQKHVGQKWVLQSADGRYPDSRSLLAKLTSEIEHTYVYDERDNRSSKAVFYGAILGQSFSAVNIS